MAVKKTKARSVEGWHMTRVLRKNFLVLRGKKLSYIGPVAADGRLLRRKNRPAWSEETLEAIRELKSGGGVRYETPEELFKALGI